MAIWLFGRKSKRHTIHLGDSETTMAKQHPSSTLDHEAHLNGRPVRTQSARRKDHHSLPAEGVANPRHNTAPVTSNHSRTNPQASSADHMTNFQNHRDSPSRSNHHAPRKDRQVKDPTSHSSASKELHTMSQNGSAAKGKIGDNGHAVLKKRLSKRSANAIAREQEIRLMSSSPIDIPRRGARNTHLAPPDRKDRDRRSDRQLSDMSLSVRDSVGSSMSDITETYMFKVNAFAALTPRPVVRHVGPQGSTARSRNTSAASMRKEGLPNLPPSEENYHSRKRVDTLADDLDAGALRELLERDRRRREKKEIDDQRRLQRKLERKAEKQRVEEERRRQEEKDVPAESQIEPPDGVYPEVKHVEGESGADEAAVPASKGLPASWLRDASIDARHSADMSLESLDAIGSLDGRSTREQNSRQRWSFAASQDIGMSRSTLSHSPVRRELSTPTSSQMNGLSRGSTSSVSRALDAERRSDLSGGHLNPFSSLIRRGSSRLKRRYRERFYEPRANAKLPNPPSHESFFKSPTPSSAPSAPLPPRAFLGAGTINRPHSRFTEHFGDGPMSPPDSRLESPDIPEECADQSGPEGSKLDTDVDNSAAEFGAELPNSGGSRIRSWGPDSMDVEPEDNVPLSQSLASIDSEGSWMSGDFLRRISHKITNRGPKSKLGEHARGDDQLAGSSASAEEAQDTSQDTLQDSSNVIGKQNQDNAAPEEDKTLRGETRKRPVLVTPTVRPKSNQGVLKDIQSLSPTSAEGPSPIESLSAEFRQTLSTSPEGESQ